MAVSTSITIDGPAPLAPRYTLLGAADTSPPPDGHWMLGATLDVYPLGPAWGWEMCETVIQAPQRGAQDRAGTKDENTDQHAPHVDPVDAFAVYLTVSCTPRGLDRAAFRQKALAAFQVYANAVVEDQFWNGTIVNTNPYLSDLGAHELTTAATDIVTAFAVLEQELADHQQAGLIHCSPRIATYAAAADLLHTEGPLLKTMLGTTVVPGQGYDGSAPEAGEVVLGLDGDDPPATEYAYCTNGVRAMRAPQPVILGGDVEQMDTTNNVLTVVVEQEFYVAWDGAVQGAVQIDPTPVVA